MEDMIGALAGQRCVSYRVEPKARGAGVGRNLRSAQESPDSEGGSVVVVDGAYIYLVQAMVASTFLYHSQAAQTARHSQDNRGLEASEHSTDRGMKYQ